MNTPEGERKKTPEFFIFDRLDELEDITLKLMEKTDVTEPTLKDTSTLARDAFILALFAFASYFATSAVDIENPRALKDTYINNLKKVGLNQERLELLESVLIRICELILKKQK